VISIKRALCLPVTRHLVPFALWPTPQHNEQLGTRRFTVITPRCRSFLITANDFFRFFPWLLAGGGAARFIFRSFSSDMTSKLGDPDYFVVSHSDMDTRKWITQWYFRDGSGGIASNEIPVGACHLVWSDTYYFATPDQHFCHNLIAETVLKEGGRKNAFCATHQIADWLKRLCALRQKCA
jgi:hypothetical protein